MPARIRSVKELRRELVVREKQLAKALAQRKKLVAELRLLDNKIAALGGEAPVMRRGKPGRKAKAAGLKRRAGKRATGKPLVEYIRKVLSKAPKGMRAKEVVPAVKAAGYKTYSKDFYGIVAAALRDTKGIRRVRRGVYRLAR